MWTQINERDHVKKKSIQTVGDLRNLLSNKNISDKSELFFFYQPNENLGLEVKSYEWRTTLLCMETDDRGRMRVGFYSDESPTLEDIGPTETLN